VVGVDGDGHGSDGGDSLLEFVLISLGHVHEAAVGGATVLRLVVARAVLSRVRVGLLSVDAVIFLDVLEGLVHQTTVATHVSVFARAVDEVLLTEGHQLASLAEVLSFQGTGLSGGHKYKVRHSQGI
jgi:hypothetical protein